MLRRDDFRYVCVVLDPRHLEIGGQDTPGWDDKISGSQRRVQFCRLAPMIRINASLSGKRVVDEVVGRPTPRNRYVMRRYHLQVLYHAESDNANFGSVTKSEINSTVTNGSGMLYYSRQP